MKTVIYARISREDENKIDGNITSRSIDNQIKSLTEYATEHNLLISKIYCDDGYSGSNINRPSFLKLLDDAYNKKFNILLIKDLSRIGRNLYQVGTLIENVFPSLNIRVISLIDNYDSLNYVENESIVLKNFLNDYYLKEFKRKCSNSVMLRANTTHISYYPKYGYLFDTEGKEVVDPFASKIVRTIFKLAKTLNYVQIASYLNEHNILTRSRYQTEVLHLKPLNKVVATKWNSSKVLEIIKDYEYCGHIINLKKRKEGPIIIKNKRPSIITEEDFNFVNEKRNNRKKEIDSRINKLNIVNYANGKKLSYSKKDNKFYYMNQYIWLSEKVLIYVLYKDCIQVLNTLDRKDLYSCLDAQSNKNLSSEQIKECLKKSDEKYAKLLELHFMNKISQSIFDSKTKLLKYQINYYNDLLRKTLNNKTDLIALNNYFKLLVQSLSNNPKNEIDLIKLMQEKVMINKKEKKEYDIIIKYKF